MCVRRVCVCDSACVSVPRESGGKRESRAFEDSVTAWEINGRGRRRRRRTEEMSLWFLGVS